MLYFSTNIGERERRQISVHILSICLNLVIKQECMPWNQTAAAGSLATTTGSRRSSAATWQVPHRALGGCSPLSPPMMNTSKASRNYQEPFLSSSWSDFVRLSVVKFALFSHLPHNWKKERIPLTEIIIFFYYGSMNKFMFFLWITTSCDMKRRLEMFIKFLPWKRQYQDTSSQVNYQVIRGRIDLLMRSLL